MTTASAPAVSPTADDKLDFRKILPVFVIVLVDLLGLTIIIPLLPLYAVTFGADPGMIGLLSATYPAMQVVGAPLLGRLSDRFGRKPVLIASQIGTFAGFILLGVAGSLPVLFLSRIIDGLSGANISTAQAVIADSTTERTRTQGLGLIGAAFGLGFIIGPIIAFVSLAISGNNFHVPAFIAAGCSLFSIVLTWFWLEETHTAARGASAETHVDAPSLFQVFARPGVGLLLLLIFFQQIAFGGLQQFLALFTLSRLGLDASGNAVVFAFVGVLIVVVQGYFIGRWSKRFGERTLITTGLALLAVGQTLLVFTPAQTVPWYDRARLVEELSEQTPTTELQPNVSVTLPDDEPANQGLLGIAWVLMTMIPAAVGASVLAPSINSLLTKAVAAGEQGGILGISAGAVSASNIIAPIMGGVLFGISIQLPFVVWGVILLLLTLAAVLLVRERPSDNASPASAQP